GGRTVRRFLASKAAVAGLVMIVVLIGIALFASVLAPHDPNFQNLRGTLRSPSGDHWLGTDTLGRDVLSRLIYGTQISLLAGAEAVFVAFVLG
ncbi:MAG TPA: ABC transporter permease, partial [Ilumatobacteraceae bacterium]|nr:ABC transporter permease [Ilumatobacteraceae bacterium]